MRFALLAFALIASTPAVAKDAPQSAASTGTPIAEAPEEKVVCKRVAASVSRVAAKRVCMTEKQWKRAASDAR